jgi:all-trans-retinol 13,14-reductase
MKYDDIVIGGGVSGMTTAILLGQQGRKVALLEKSPRLALTIRGFSRGDVYFDTGFHYGGMLGEGEALTTLCEKLGILGHIEPRKHRQSSARMYCMKSDFRFDSRTPLAGLTEQLIETFPDDSEAIRVYMSGVKKRLDMINRDIFDVAIRPEPVFEQDHVSLEEYLREHFKSPLLQTLLSVYSVLYGSMPGETSLDFHSMIAGAYYDQSWQIADGGCAITQAFEEKLRESGVDIYANCAAGRINLGENKAVTGVSLENGDIVECGNCVFTAHPSQLERMLPDGSLRPVYLGRMKSLENSFSAVVVYCSSVTARSLGTSVLVNELFPDIYKHGDDFADRLMFVCRSLSESHMGGISIICPCSFQEVRQWEASTAGNRPRAYYEWKKRAAEAIVERVKRCLGNEYSDLKILDAASPLTLRDYMNAPEGCLYGVKHRVTDVPFMPQTKIKGLYLSGQVVVSPGLLGAMLAGFMAAGAITGKDYRQALK